MPSAVGALRTGIRVLFRTDGVLTVSTLLTFGIVMVMGSFQGLVLPVFFTDSGRPELLGYVLSTMSLGLLASSLAYAAFAPRLSRRTWYVLSMFGMLLGVAILGALPAYPLMLLGAPFVFIIAPRQGVVTAGLAVAFLFAVLFDVVNVRNLLRALRVARRATS